MHGRFAGIALAVAASLALPGAAGAATKTVQVGPYGERQAAFQKVFGDANAYFRKTVTIHKGDKVRWSINGFHSVTFVPADEQPPALIVPDPSTPVSGVNDAAGSPFWFNGQPTLRPNPLAVAPQGGKTFSPNSLRNSGLPLGEGPPPPYTLRFKRKGTFRYLCVVHPGMTGKVKVVGADRSIPSAGDDRRAARRQQKAALQQVQRLTTGLGTEDLEKTIQAGNDRRSGATVFRFFPANPSYKVGDTVTLRMPAVSSEAHTFTFGPTNGKDAYNDQLAAGLLGEVFDPRGAYPSEPPPAGVPSITTAQHGNGFFNSGVLDQDSASPQPASTKVTFGAPGTYQLICLIHPFMTNTVTVTP
jgi:plastocyanin